MWNDKIIVSRGDYDNVTFLPILFNSYLQVYNSSDLSLHMEIDTLNGPNGPLKTLSLMEIMMHILLLTMHTNMEMKKE